MSTRRPLAALIFVLLGLPTLFARQDGPAGGPFEELPLRVLQLLRPGVVVVDRGGLDGLLEDDPVLLFPRDGGPWRGVVIQVDERTAAVRMDDRRLEPAVGTRGRVRVPAARLADLENELPAPQGPVQHAPWVREDDDWEPGMPLLSAVEVRTPDQRPTRVSGRLYAIADATWASVDDRSDLFVRFGQDVRVENPFGNGGRFHYDGELNHRDADVPPPSDRSFTKFRVERLSYEWGGTRFDPVRQQVGRFLQQGVPEFGVIDGYEWGKRLDDGRSYGGSVGFMPTPDADYDSTDDFQVSGYYRWVMDESERYAVTGGFQKTWHDGAVDRDLLVAKVHVLPAEGWSLQGTAWVDFYTSSDDEKGVGPELTQAYARASRRWEDGDGLDIVWTHLRFPEIDRQEFIPVTADELADARNDRLHVYGFTPLGESTLLTGEVGVWDDQDDSGGDVEAGLELSDVFVRGGWANVSAFFVDGRFSRGYGGRLAYGQQLDRQRWDVRYDVSRQENHDFDVDFADFVQHWLRASWGLDLDDGWDLSVTGGVRLWDDNDENAQQLSVYAQKRF